MEKKKLTKLVLHKEPIANLNDRNMSQLKGGSGWTKYTPDIVDTLTKIYDIYSEAAKENSLWPYDCHPTDIYNSQVFVYGGCLISPVEVTP